MIKYIAIGFILLSINMTAVALPTAKLTLKVVDEAGLPIEDAEADLLFILSSSGLGTKTVVEKGLTDRNGLYTGSGNSPQYVFYGARKEGYYLTTGGRFRMESVSGIFGFRRWQPWNPILEVVLKKKINPIPLYAINMKAKKLPITDKFIGFDLIAHDWVVPYGQGTHRDFLFKLEKYRMAGGRDYHVTLTLQFPNEGDGIQSYYDKPDVGSSLRLPHKAPTTGYLNEVIINRDRSPDKRTKSENKRNREDQNYFFRIRTEKDEKGNIVNALYGKIHGGIELYNFKKKDFTGKVGFDYYLNPSLNDTNLEFDPRKNLFTDLIGLEEVVLP